MLQSDICDYSGAYIAAKGNISAQIQIMHHSLAIFQNFISNLMKYSKDYSKTSGFLWNYYRDEPNSGAVGNVNYSIKNSKSKNSNFNNKASITGKLENNNVEKEGVEIVAPLKHLKNFWGTLDIPLINCEVSLSLTWSGNCVSTSKATRNLVPAQGVNPTVTKINIPTNATFKKTDTKLYVPVLTLSTQDDNKLLEQLKKVFKRTVKWNKYRSEMSKQTKNNNLNSLIDPAFTKSIDYLSYHLKMKMIELLFQRIIHQVLK